MISSVVKPKFVWLVNTPMGPRSELAPGDGVISGIVSWGYMRSNRVILVNKFGKKKVSKDSYLFATKWFITCIEVRY